MPSTPINLQIDPQTSMSVNRPESSKQQLQFMKTECVVHEVCEVEVHSCECIVKEPERIHKQHQNYESDCGTCYVVALDLTDSGTRVSKASREIKKQIKEFRRQLFHYAPTLTDNDYKFLESFVTGALTPRMLGLLSATYGCRVRSIISNFHLEIRHNR